jgi:hypothetical protein
MEKLLAANDELSTVIEIRPREGRFAHTIYQEDIEELLRRSVLLDHARDRYLQMRDYLKAALRGGARVEPGLHEARLEMLKREEYTVKPSLVEKLVVS